MGKVSGQELCEVESSVRVRDNASHGACDSICLEFGSETQFLERFCLGHVLPDVSFMRVGGSGVQIQRTHNLSSLHNALF